MLQRIAQSWRRFVGKTTQARPSQGLDVTALEERATPATGPLIAPIQAPVMYVLAALPSAPPASDVAAKSIVRLDITADGGSTQESTQDWSDMMVGASKAPRQELDAPAPPPAANAEDLALLEAEWVAVQPMA